jgi:hypothetical protein
LRVSFQSEIPAIYIYCLALFSSFHFPPLPAIIPLRLLLPTPIVITEALMALISAKQSNKKNLIIGRRTLYVFLQ